MSVLLLLTAVLYGVVEGITEWLPVSSTGHLLLLQKICPMPVSDAFWELFLVVVQCGAIFAVAVFYRKQLCPFTAAGRRLSVNGSVLSLWGKIAIACIPGGIYALLLDDIVGNRFYTVPVISVMLITVGMLFFHPAFRSCDRGGNAGKQVNGGKALIIGLCQLVAAVFPGTSRSGATILGGMACGLSRTTAAEFTFFLAVPVMAGESLLKLLKFGLSFTGTELMLLLAGTGVSFAASLISIRFLLDYVKRHDFRVFGWYRIVLGIVTFLFLRG